MVSTKEGAGQKPVDAWVLVEVKDAAAARADREGQSLASVARAAIWARTRALEETGVDPHADDAPITPASEETTRFRFYVPTEPYKKALATLRKHKLSMVSVVQQGFSHYARTGEME